MCVGSRQDTAHVGSRHSISVNSGFNSEPWHCPCCSSPYENTHNGALVGCSGEPFQVSLGSCPMPLWCSQCFRLPQSLPFGSWQKSFPCTAQHPSVCGVASVGCELFLVSSPHPVDVPLLSSNLISAHGPQHLGTRDNSTYNADGALGCIFLFHVPS